MSDIFDKLNNIAGQNNISPDMVNNLFNMFNNSNNSNNQNTSTNSSDTSSNQDYNNSVNNQNNPFGNSGIDFETILKMKSIIDKMNTKDDPRSNLLQSLKPYLKDSRKSKIDQYIQLMNMSKVMDVFPFMGGDIKK
jgi:hypothetical protein